MDEKGQVSLEDMKAIQQYVYMKASAELSDLLIDKINELGAASDVTEQEQQLLDLVANWDGHYHAHSQGAMAYELLRKEFAILWYRPIFGDTNLASITKVIGGEFRVTMDLNEADQAKIADTLRAAIKGAAKKYDGSATWGSAHSLELTHPFSAIPIVGKRYRFGGKPIGGSTQTLAKSGHVPSGKDFVPHHGATARFVSDLSALNENYVVLISGQDGWFQSSTFMDQTDMFLSGQYIQMPLGVEAFAKRATHVHELK